MSARDSDADFAAAIADYRAAHDATVAAIDDLDAERNEFVRREIAWLEAWMAANPKRLCGGDPLAFAYGLRLSTLRRAYPHIGRTA